MVSVVLLVVMLAVVLVVWLTDVCLATLVVVLCRYLVELLVDGVSAGRGVQVALGEAVLQGRGGRAPGGRGGRQVVRPLQGRREGGEWGVGRGRKLGRRVVEV